MNKKIFGLLSVIFVIFLFVGMVHADEILLNPIADSYINQADQFSINGAKTSLVASYEGQGLANIALVKFDLTKIPKGSSIYSAAFQLTSYSCSGGDSSPELNLSTIDENWKEETVRWAGRPGFGFDSNVIKPEIKTLGWLVKSKVQNWVDSPDGNFGFAISIQGGPYTCKFYSREYSNTSVRPALVIKYTPPPSPTPSPIKLNIGKLIISPIKLKITLTTSPSSSAAIDTTSSASVSPTPENVINDNQGSSEEKLTPTTSIIPSAQSEDKKVQSDENITISKSKLTVMALIAAVLILLGIVGALILKRKKFGSAPYNSQKNNVLEEEEEEEENKLN